MISRGPCSSDAAEQWEPYDARAPLRRGRRPGNDENASLVVSRCALCKLDLDRRSRYDDALDRGPEVCVEVDSAQARGWKIGGRAAPARASLSAVQSARALTEWWPQLPGLRQVADSNKYEFRCRFGTTGFHAVSLSNKKEHSSIDLWPLRLHHVEHL